MHRPNENSGGYYLTAYGIAVAHGYRGSEADWLASLQGSDGEQGAQGEAGEDGIGIASMEQTTTSTASGGKNVWTATTTDGTEYTFEVRNGSRGATGETGATGADGKGFTILGYYSSLDALEAAVTDPEAGDAYAIGAESPYSIYVYDTTQGWVDNGELQGAAGVGIASMEQTTTSTASGGENVWTCTLDDGTTYTFTVYNGAQGEQGEAGSSFTILGYYETYDSLDESVTSPAQGDVYAVGDGAPYEIYIYDTTQGWVDNGQLQGAEGVGVESVEQTTTSTASGGANVVTFTLSDDSSYDITIYNGAQGEQGEQGEQGVQGDAGEGVPSGGSSGQVLTKASDDDYDTSWQTVSAGSNVVVGRYTGSASTSDETAQTITLSGTPLFVWVGMLEDEEDVNYMGQVIPWYHYVDTDEEGNTTSTAYARSGYALNGYPFYGGYDYDDSSDGPAAALEVTTGGFKVRNVRGERSTSTRSYDSHFYLNRTDCNYFYLAVLE